MTATASKPAEPLGQSAADQHSPGRPRQLDAMRFSTTLGQIVAVLARMQNHRHTFLADLDWLVLPAIASRQFAIDTAPFGGSVINGPAAVVLWARVSPEVDQRLTANPGYRVRLRPEEWVSGSIPWLVEAVGEPRAVQALVKALVERRFAATGVKTYSAGAGGKPVVGVLRAEASTPAEVEKRAK